ncbi:MAG: hypothetical protein JO263_02990 [Candidatus Eremiobacteraeota bacterium]|nr:hypothetical protein [Candidatus Eremiobacteraeota bacterium]
MSQLLERRFVGCPYHLAQEYLAQMIGPKVSSPPAPLTLTLSLPGAELIKEVVVTYGAAIDRMHFDEPWKVHWKPKAGPYPEFDGELTVRADETYSSSQLELQGSYRPPGGALGAAFDVAVGSRIARATAQALLERLGSAMESRYARDERSKAGAS